MNAISCYDLWYDAINDSITHKTLKALVNIVVDRF